MGGDRAATCRRGAATRRTRRSSRSRTSPTADGWIVVACPKQKFWAAALRRDRAARAGRRDVPDASPTATARRDELVPILEDVFRDADERRVARGARRGGRARRRRSTTCEAALERGAGSSSTSTRALGTVRQVASPLRLSGRGAAGCGRRRTRGEHTEQVLVELCGYAPERVRELAAAGVFGDRERSCKCLETQSNLRGSPRRSLRTRPSSSPATPVYTAGQIANGPDGNLVEGGIEEQTRQALENVRTCVEAGGLHDGRRRQGERVPRRPRRLPGLQPGLRRVLRRAVPGADVACRPDCRRACSSRSRRSPGGRHERPRPRRLRRRRRRTRSGRAARGSRSASSSTTRRAASGRRSRATRRRRRSCTRSSARRRRSAGANLNTESMFEFGSRAGFWRVHRIFTAHGLPLTVYAVGQALERNPEAARAMVDAGWEVASHGWRWIDYLEMPEDEEREHIRRAIEAIEKACGSRPGRLVHGPDLGEHAAARRRGGRLPLRLGLVRRRAAVLGRRRRPRPPRHPVHARRERLQVPAARTGSSPPSDFLEYLVDSFEQLHAEGGRMMSVGLHCRIVGRPGRAPALDRFLAHVKRADDVWVTTRAEIARHWHSATRRSPAA